MIETPSATEEFDPARFVVKGADRHSAVLTLADAHFQQRSLSVLLQSDDERQAFRLIHETHYCGPNRILANRVMKAWAEKGNLTEAVRFIDDDEAWKVRLSNFPLNRISMGESIAHRAIVELRKNQRHGE